MDTDTEMGTMLYILVLLCPVLLVHGQCPSSGCSRCISKTAVCESACPRELATDLVQLTLLRSKCDELKSGILRSQLRMLPKLQYLLLNSCNITHLWGSPFSQNLELTTLRIQNNKFQSIHNDTFKNLTNLINLDLMRNQINRIDDYAFVDLIALTTLKLSINKMSSFTDASAKGLSGLKTLDLSYNEVSQMEATALFPLIALETIILSHNQLTSIPDNLFSNSHHLINVNLDSNLISSIEDLAFSGTSLDQLNLASNSLTSVPNFKTWKSSPKTLDLKHNSISLLKADDFAGMTITTLDLSDNPITDIEDGAFTSSRVSELNLMSTNLTSLPESMSSLTKSGTSFKLDSRDWRCECDQLWLGRYLLTSVNSYGPTCGQQKYSGKPFTDIVEHLEAECTTTTTTRPMTTVVITLPTSSKPTTSPVITVVTTLPTYSKPTPPSTIKVHTSSTMSASVNPGIFGMTSKEARMTDSTPVLSLPSSTSPAATTSPESGKTHSVQSFLSSASTPTKITSTDSPGAFDVDQTNTSQAPMIAGIICAVLLVGAAITGVFVWKMKHKVKPSLSSYKGSTSTSDTKQNLPESLTQTSHPGQPPQSTNSYHGQVDGPSQVRFQK